MKSSHAFLLVVALIMCSCADDTITIAPSNSVQNPSNEKMQLNLKVYVETSAGMDGYLCDGSDLRTVIYDYIDKLSHECDSTKFYHANDKIVPFKGNIEAFKSKGLTPNGFKSAGSGRNYSDIAAIIGRIVNEMNENTVSIFVSDCILDIKGADAKKNLEIKKSEVEKAILRGIDKCDFAVEVLKMSGLFNGTYYPPSGKPQKLSGDSERPYYIWIFGDRKALAQLHKEQPINKLNQHKLQHIITFTKHANAPFEVKNKNGQDKIRAINGSYSAFINADFSSLLQDDETILNPENYLSKRREMKIKSIKKKENDPRWTHVIEIEFPANAKLMENDLAFCRPELPEWIEESNDPNGNDAQANIDKTFGIKYLIGGVAEAYEKEKEFTNFNMKIKNK